MRTVNLSLAELPNAPLANARVTFRPLKKGQATASDVWPSLTHSVTTDANGDATLQLPTNIEIEVTLPDGWRGTIIVPPGATPITLQALLLGNATPPNNWQVLLDAHEQKIAGVGPSGVLGHVRVDGATVTVNPSTGVISATGSGGAPVDAQYIVAAADPTLTAERVATDTATVAWDFSTPGQARAGVVDGSIDTTHLANGAVTGPKIASNAVTTPKIQDGAVLYDKIQDVAPNRLLGRGATAGPPEEIQIGANLSLSGGTLSASGGATNLGYVPAPTSGQVTSSTGTPATIPQADLTNAGLLNPTDKNKLNHYQLSIANNQIALGRITLPTGNDTVAVGTNQGNTGYRSVNLGAFSAINAGYSTVVGYGSTVNTDGSVAVGSWCGCNGVEAIAIGHQTGVQSGNPGGVAIGTRSSTPAFTGTYVALGPEAEARAARQFVVSTDTQVRPSGTKHFWLQYIKPNDASRGRYAGGFIFRWTDNVVATRKGRVDVVACDATSNERIGFTVESDGTNPRVSVLGATPIARATAPAAATDLASAITLVNALRQLMIDFGLWET